MADSTEKAAYFQMKSFLLLTTLVLVFIDRILKVTHCVVFIFIYNPTDMQSSGRGFVNSVLKR